MTDKQIQKKMTKLSVDELSKIKTTLEARIVKENGDAKYKTQKLLNDVTRCIVYKRLNKPLDSLMSKTQKWKMQDIKIDINDCHFEFDEDSEEWIVNGTGKNIHGEEFEILLTLDGRHHKQLKLLIEDIAKYHEGREYIFEMP